MSANRRRWSHLSCLRAMVLQTLLSRSGLGSGRNGSALWQSESEARRKPPQFTNPASAEASNGVPARAFAPPTRSTKSNTPTSRSSRTNDTTSTPASLIEQTDNSEQMAASQRRLFEQMVTLRTRLNERLAASNKFAKYLESTLHARDKDIKHANERLVAGNA